MVTIVGHGMGPNRIDHLDLDLNQYKYILCDSSYETTHENVIKGNYKELKEIIIKNKDEQLLFVVAGSPLFYSGANTVTSLLEKKEIAYKIINNESSLVYMLKHFGIAYQNVAVENLHDKVLDLNTFMQKQFTFILCDEESIALLQENLKYVSNYKLTIGERLGYEDESIREVALSELKLNSPKLPFALLLEKLPELPQQKSNSDVEIQITMKTQIYSFYLDLEPNCRVWEISSGRRVLSVEAYKRFRTRSVIFEKDDSRKEVLEAELRNEHVIDCRIETGNIKELYKKERMDPDRIFIDGGSSEIVTDIDYLFKRLKSKGVLLMNFYSLKLLNLAISNLELSRIEYELESIFLSSYSNKQKIAEPQRLVHQIKISKQ